MFVTITVEAILRRGMLAHSAPMLHRGTESIAPAAWKVPMTIGIPELYGKVMKMVRAWRAGGSTHTSRWVPEGLLRVTKVINDAATTPESFVYIC